MVENCKAPHPGGYPQRKPGDRLIIHPADLSRDI
jgi:hypothetical protein